jgi:hypothetical protein
MAKASPEIVFLLRKTAEKLEESQDYQWGHMGSCNCGFLVQEVTRVDRNKIHSYAMERSGDWCEQLVDYCPTSGKRLDELVDVMLSVGFTLDDLRNLERLSDPHVLKHGLQTKRNLRHNLKRDVVIYLRAWAAMLEQQIDSVYPDDIDRMMFPGEDKAAHNLLVHSSDSQT